MDPETSIVNESRIRGYVVRSVNQKRQSKATGQSEAPERSRDSRCGGDGDRVLRGKNNAASQPIGTKI
jgi:hypothetical protein